MFVRAFIIAVTVAAIWWPLRSFGLGLGLGDASVESTLSSPLRIDIPLRGMEGISLDPEKFSIVIEDASRPNMKYRLERIDGDSATIVLYTRQMVTDPLVHFRLKVKWDKSAIARSYDVFIDPPAYQFATSDKPVTPEANEVTPVEIPDPVAADAPRETPAAVAQETSEPVFQPIAANSDVAVAEVESETETDRNQATASEFSAGIPQQRREYGPTIDGNSIWRVARAVSTDNSELTIYQWMYGIWKANPQAFTRSNMHRLNMGELLNIPLEREIAETSHSDAWRAYSSQMALLQPPTEVRNSIISTPGELISGGAQQPGLAAIDGSLIAAIKRMDEDAMNASTIASLEEIEASNDIETVEASIVTDSLSSENTEVFEDTDVVQDLLEDASPVSEAGATIDQSVAAGEVTLITAVAETVPQATAADALEAPGEFVAQPPVIGSDAPLAFIGRAWQRVDGFVSNSSSWAAMASGGGITLALLMLFQQFRGRRRVATAEMQRSGIPMPLSMQVTLQDPEPADAADAADESPVEDEPEIEGAADNLNDQDDTPIDLESSEPPAVVESRQSRVKRGKDRRASDRRVAARSSQPNGFNFKSDEILEKANTFMASGDSSEAVKLLELTVKLQPDRLNLVLRLLEIYYLLKNAEAFEILVQRFKPALQVMEISKQIDLQVMYSKLCPDSPPLLDPDNATDLDDQDRQLRDGVDVAGEVDIDTGALAAGQADGLDDGVDEGDYIATQVIVFNNGAVLDENAAAGSGMVGEAVDPGVTLQEVDVYLAYGLYDSAEELLIKGMTACPGRVDFMARLLDSYYATRNVVDFEIEAEVMKSLGDAADPYWEKVVIMGYELAPYNKMFAEGKGKSLGVSELEAAKPELPDFDLGAIDGVGSLSSAEIDQLADRIDTTLDEVALDDDEINLDADELALDEDLNLDLDEVALDGDADDLEVSEITLDDDDEITLEQAEIAIDDDDTELTDVDLAAAFTETNLNLGAEIEENAVEMNELSEDDQRDGDDEVVLDIGDDEEFMEFTIPGESDPEQPDSGVSVDDGGSAAVKISAEKDDEGLNMADSRILYFPDSSSDKLKSEQFEEFASEVRMTLQAIRDQLQNITERQYRQERETHELHKSIAEMSGDSPETGRKQNKKSS